MMEDNIDICFYHAPCTDGLVASWVVKKRYPSATLIPLYLTRSLTEQIFSVGELKDKNIIFVDICPDVSDLDRLRTEAQTVLVLDHHETSYKSCKDHPSCMIDKSQSGAGLAWRVLFPNLPPPKIVLYTEDHDLWLHKLPHSMVIKDYIFTYAENLDRVDFIHDALENRFNDCIISGQSISAYKDTMIQWTLNYKPEFWDILGTRVLVVNSPVNRSEIGNKLISDDVPVVGVYWVVGAEINFSFRSDDRVDSSVLAEKVAIYANDRHGVNIYRGGGHMKAAGVRLPIEDFFFREKRIGS